MKKKNFSLVILAIVVLSLALLTYFLFVARSKSFNINDALIEVEAGESFYVYLESNRTTGYAWIPDYDESFLVLEKEEYEDAPGNQLGRGGTDFFFFQAPKKGEGILSFLYSRPWEETQSSNKTKFFNVIVQ
ncbi:MAG: hypothetical protein A2418_01210 [Candidatus Brennerbacteria bacterium RIFOXYC1_FULL_41_11]|nr:MAG: hypothetical protein A2418_01210 [Candidatus Brennerbacteria bacterium RIFOXYC1_FULL_41_11]